MPERTLEISVVTTIYNSAPIIPELIARISQACEKVSDNYEVILVEDRGGDDSWEVIERICAETSFVKGIQLSRNMGQQVAMSAGLRYASGHCVVILDGDLQNPPEAIPQIIEKLRQGNDIVYTISKTRNNFQDRLTSQLFWHIMTRWFKLNIVPNQLMMKGMVKNFVDKYNQYEERVRVVSGIVMDVGMKHETLLIENQKRKHGKSNYNFFKRFHLMIDVIIAMTNTPLNYLINLSLISLFITFVLGLYNLIVYIVSDVPAGYTTIVLLILFFGSLTSLILGIIGRYVSNIYIEVRNRPLFFVGKKVNL